MIHVSVVGLYVGVYTFHFDDMEFNKGCPFSNIELLLSPLTPGDVQKLQLRDLIWFVPDILLTSSNVSYALFR